MPKELTQKPTSKFRGAVEGAVSSENPKGDIEMLNTSPEVIQNLMKLNQQKNKLIRADHKQFGIQPEDFNIDDEVTSFFIDNTGMVGARSDAANFKQVK